MPTPHTKPPIELIARGLILHQSHALMCRSIAGNYYYLPGGHIEFAEPASTALQRECMEEMGLRIDVGPLLLTAENTFHDGTQEHHEITLVFHVEQFTASNSSSQSGSGEPGQPVQGELPTIESREDGIEFEWVDLAAVAGLDIRPIEIRAWLAAGGSGGGHITGFELAVPGEPVG